MSPIGGRDISCKACGDMMLMAKIYFLRKIVPGGPCLALSVCYGLHARTPALAAHRTHDQAGHSRAAHVRDSQGSVALTSCTVPSMR